jgi:hypothetical protein
MKQIAVVMAGAGALAALAVSLSGVATAAGGTRADDTINELQSAGYSVRVNGAATAPLSACTVSNVVHGADGSSAEVSLVCPDGC